MAGTKPSVSTHFKQSIIGLSLRLTSEIEICSFAGEIPEFPRAVFSSKNQSRVDRQSIRL